MSFKYEKEVIEVPRTIFNKGENLSLSAIGLYSILFALPEGKSDKSMVEQIQGLTDLSKDEIMEAANELEDKCFLTIGGNDVWCLDV